MCTNPDFQKVVDQEIVGKRMDPAIVIKYYKEKIESKEDEIREFEDEIRTLKKAIDYCKETIKNNANDKRLRRSIGNSTENAGDGYVCGTCI